MKYLAETSVLARVVLLLHRFWREKPSKPHVLRCFPEADAFCYFRGFVLHQARIIEFENLFSFLKLRKCNEVQKVQTLKIKCSCKNKCRKRSDSKLNATAKLNAENKRTQN